MTKSELLNACAYPREWLAWELYPDTLFEVQRAECAGDEEPHADEHLRYGAFTWWLRTHRSLPILTLMQLSQLAALDPDPAMSGAAAHDILCHPSATEEVADELAQLTERQPGWHTWAAKPTPLEFFRRMLDDGRRFWLERHATYRVIRDIELNQLSVDDLRELFALRSPLVLRALVEHPELPKDLLSEMTTMEGLRFAKEIRTLSKLRIGNKRLPRTTFRGKYSTDPWLWQR